MGSEVEIGPENMVGDSYRLRIDKMIRGARRTGGLVADTGSCEWTLYTLMGEVNCRLKLDIDHKPILQLSVPRPSDAMQSLLSSDYVIHLSSTKTNFGGFRPCFLCPLCARLGKEPRKCRVLYLPWRGKYFGCRGCHDLRYFNRSKEDKALERMELKWQKKYGRYG